MLLSGDQVIITREHQALFLISLSWGVGDKTLRKILKVGGSRGTTSLIKTWWKQREGQQTGRAHWELPGLHGLGGSKGHQDREGANGNFLGLYGLGGILFYLFIVYICKR